MCIQDNPRYIKLVEMGMPDTTEFTCYINPTANFCFVTVRPDKRTMFSVRKNQPEDAISLAFTVLEVLYAVHQ